MNEMTQAARFVGQRVPRKEDRRLLTGNGAYTDDITVPGMLHAAFVRSYIARGTIKSINTDAAKALPGVHAVYVADDLRTLDIKFLQLYSSPTAPAPAMWPLADGRIAHVGEPVVIVLADSRALAEDGAALVEVDYESEEPVVTLEQARALTKAIHPDLGVKPADTMIVPSDDAMAETFAKAAHVVTGTIRHQRQAHSPMETRGVVAQPKGTGELTVWVSCQSPHMAARYLSEAFNLPAHSIRVIAKDVGGAFGLKVQLWREEVAAVAAALIANRPVKWIEDRLENLTSANQAREQEVTVKLALDADAKLLAADLEYHSNIGAFPHGIGANALGMMMFPGPYRLPRLSVNANAYFSNTCGEAAFRGPWMVESLARETMLDVAARQIGIDPLEIRRRNLITREEQPFTTCMGTVLNWVTPRETLELAVEKIDVAAFRAEQAKARTEGRYLGLGFATYVEPTTMNMGGVLSSEWAQVQVEPTGKVTAVISTHSQGHGTETTMAQVIADELGVPFNDVSVFEDDSSRGSFGAGAGGSRQAVAGGGAAIHAIAILKAKIKAIAAHLLNASADAVEIESGMIRVKGVEEMTTSLASLAATAYFETPRLPPGMEAGLTAQYRYSPPPFVFSNATHACVCEVDRDTGVVKILRWVASEDCGVMINPSVVEGQIAGGVTQGVGGVLMEQIRYDADGNPTAATFKDYLVPGIFDMPEIEYCHMITPADNPGGFKGIGEGGAIIGPPTIINAVADALSPFGVRTLDLPLSPPRLLALMDGAEAK